MLGAGVPLCGAWQDRLPAMSLAKAALSALLGAPASSGIGVFVPGDTHKTHPVCVGGQLLCRVMDSPTGKAVLLLDRCRQMLLGSSTTESHLGCSSGTEPCPLGR